MASVQKAPTEPVIPKTVLRIAPRPAEAMVLVDVDSRTAGLVLGRSVIPSGKSRVAIPSSYLRAAQALVEDRKDLLVKAEKHLKRLYADAEKKRPGVKPEVLPFSLAASFRKVAEADPDVDERDRDLRPLVSLDVVKGSDFIKPADGEAEANATMKSMVKELVRELMSEMQSSKK